MEIPLELQKCPSSFEEAMVLSSFLSTLKKVEASCGNVFESLTLEYQNTIIMARLNQLVNICRLNPLWRSRIDCTLAGRTINDVSDWESIPVTDKKTFHDMFSNNRSGMVAPLEENGFMIVASGGTSSNKPSETVYSLAELRDTYKWSGAFMGRNIVKPHLLGDGPKWFTTTLADYQMWSSGTMVGGVLQCIPDVNYVGAGPMSREVFQHLMSYPGPKALMGITASIELLPSFSVGLPQKVRESLHVAMFGSGTLSQKVKDDLVSAYPNVKILSYFAATQAETIGLQLRSDNQALTTIPGLHFVEILDDHGRGVKVGEEGELVVTRLFGNAAPCLRYMVGDRVRRLEDHTSDELNAMQFSFVGRSGDFMHLGDTQYSVERCRAALVEELKRRSIIDLDAIAIDFQFQVDRSNKSLIILVSCENPKLYKKNFLNNLRGISVQEVIISSLVKSLSVFNSTEANEYNITSIGFRFGLKIVSPDAVELVRTAVGKLPLLVDQI